MTKIPRCTSAARAALVGTVAVAFAGGAARAAPAEEGAAGPGEAGPSVRRAAEPGVPASLPDAVDKRLMDGKDLTFPEIMRAGGALSYLLLLLSVAAVASTVYCFVECRPGRVVPRAEHGEILARLAARDRAGALAAVEAGKSFYARAARACLTAAGDEPSSASGTSLETLRSLMRASGERDAAVLRGRAALVAQIGAVAALVGLLGTLVGMTQAFGIAAREVYEPVLAYAAVFKALVTSLLGVGLATLALVAHYVLSHVLERSLGAAAYAFEEILAALRWTSSREGEGSKGGPAVGAPPGERGSRK